MRRTAGAIVRNTPDDLLRHLTDWRNRRGIRWKAFKALVRIAMFGLAAGCKSLQELEELTEEMPPVVRRKLGFGRRLPDTTERTLLCKLDPVELGNILAVIGYDAWRRKALHQDPDLPWGVFSLDGKYPSIRDVGHPDAEDPAERCYEFLQVHHDENDNPTHGTVRTITATLISAVGRPILAATPVPGDTNEVGHFQKAFGDLVRMYGRLFRVVMYDAGGTSHDNLKAVLAAGKHAIFQIADPRWVMYQTVELLFRGNPADVVHEEVESSHKRVVRHVTVLPVRPTAKNLTIWAEVKTIVKVFSETFEKNKKTGTETCSTKTRYYISTLESTELTAAQWLRIIVLRWGVESSHQILDTAFQEDKRPWITKDAQGALAVMLLRRVVYTILTLFKHVTLRAEDNHLMPWRKLMERIKDVLKWATEDVVDGLRSPSFKVPPALA
jgi:hypothetical protein